MDQRRRRIDRVAAPDLLDGVGQLTVDDVRALRDECRHEEARLSYQRRVLQAKIDIVDAHVAARTGGDPPETASLLERLPVILGDDAPPGDRVPRAAPLYTPEDGDTRRRDDADPDDGALGRVPDLPDAELHALAERLVREERIISELRRVVLDHLDGLQAELVARYRDGGIAVDDVVRAAAAPTAGASQRPRAGRDRA